MAKGYIPNTKLIIIQNIDKLDNNIEINLCNLMENPKQDEFIDIRQWNNAHNKCTYGVSLSLDQAEQLCDALATFFGYEVTSPFFEDDDSLAYPRS